MDSPIKTYICSTYIAAVLGGAKVVGLGESTHGTHEFFVAKSEIIKSLVCEHGFNTLFGTVNL